MEKEKKITLVGIAIIFLLVVFTLVELCSMYQFISKLERDIKNLQIEINIKYKDIQKVNNEIANKENELSRAKERLREISSEVTKLMQGKKYKLHDPTYSEVMNFLIKDNTNYKSYDAKTFNCLNYAQEVNNNAEELGIRCALVLVNLSRGAHALVAFNVEGKEIIYIEPQTDRRVNLQRGKDYWADCVEPPPGYYYLRDPDNIVVDFTLIW